MTGGNIRLLEPRDRRCVRQFISERWGGETIVVHGDVFYPHKFPGFVAVEDGKRVGLVTYHMGDRGCEIVTLDSIRPGRGIGTTLIEAVKEAVRQEGIKRVCVTRTNDNVGALRFYQKRGFVLVAVHRDAVEAARKIKPEIPRTGASNIPIRDEIELEAWVD
jgi:GNAT superfamily N-acetyltransferase